jgi:hypothetical protein
MRVRPVALVHFWVGTHTLKGERCGLLGDVGGPGTNCNGVADCAVEGPAPGDGAARAAHVRHGDTGLCALRGRYAE